MNSLVLSWRNVRVVAGGQTILAVENLALSEGGFLAVMGPNGAGKTTLLRTSLGLQPHTRGEVVVFGQTLSVLSGGELLRLRRGIGYVPQLASPRGELPLTVREVVAIGRTGRAGLFRALRPADWQIADEWLERLGLAELARRGFDEISGGEQRKVMIARAMAQEPRLLLLDEPTAHLDLGWRERLVETIQSLYEQNRLTVVLVCHELEVLPPCCRRVVLLNRGAVLADGTPQEVFTTARIRELYGSGLTVAHQSGRHIVLPGERMC